MGFLDGFWQSDQAQPTTPTGDPAPQYGQQYGLLGNSQGLADFVNQHGQSMMGMGMGLMSGNRGMGDALTGWQAGAKQDMLASIQTEKRKKDQMAREAALSFAKSRGLSPAQTAMLIANPEVAAHVLQTQLEPKEKSLTDQIIASLPADQRQEYINRQILGRKDEKSLRKWDTVGEDEFGNKIKGWVDANDKSVDPYRLGDGSSVGGGNPDGPRPGVGVTLPRSTTGTGGQPQADKPMSFNDYRAKYPDVDPKELRKKYTDYIGKKEFGNEEMGKPIPSETAGKVALAKIYLNESPQIAAAIKAGTATGPFDYQMGKLGKGAAGAVHGQMASGADALVRGLTGAGMGIKEAEDYASRFRPTATDNWQDLMRKHTQLAERLQGVVAGVYEGRIPKGSKIPGLREQPPEIVGGGAAAAGGNETAPAAPAGAQRGLGSISKHGVRFAY